MVRSDTFFFFLKIRSHYTTLAGLELTIDTSVGGGLLVLFPAAQPRNNHTDTVLIKSLLGLLALASYWLTLIS